MKIIKKITLALSIIPLTAFAGLESVIINPGQIPAGWGTPYSHYEVSVNAMVFFDNYEPTYSPQLGEELVQKKFQSFSSNTRGTVFYLEFKSKGAAEKVAKFAQNLIWEGSQPTTVHPEKIFVVDTTLVIISAADPSLATQLEQIIRK